jgi:hypothetical protein
MITESKQDAEQLQLLSIFHYVVAAIQALVASIPIFHFLLGVALVLLPQRLGAPKEALPATFVGSFIMLFTGTWLIVGWTLVVCTVIAGRSLQLRKRYLFCFVIACIEGAMCMPFGTVLGVFTIIVLLRPSVKEAFGVASH